jgi:cupin fold WbuC family metalloprotein
MMEEPAPMKLITADLLNGMIAEAGRRPRRRTNHNIHASAADPVQRYLIAARKDAYFRPHRHTTRWEFIIVLKGRFDVIVLDEDGRVSRRVAVGPGEGIIGFELPPGTWHAWVPMTDTGVFAEVKEGPYDPSTAAEFAPWSPPEGAPGVREFLDRMRRADVGDRLA